MKKVRMQCRDTKRIRIPFIAFLMVLSTHAFAQIQTNVPALKDVYANDFTIGCLLSYRHVGFPSDSAVTGQSAVVDVNGGYLIKYHMNCMSPGNNMKPQNTVNLPACSTAYANATPGAARDSIDVHPVIRFNGDMIAQLNWAKRQGFTFRGHTLVWYNQTPGPGFFYTGYSTTNARLTKEVMTERMDNYIGEVIRLIHEGWPGLLSAMDVVNEAVNDNTGTDRTTGNEWYTTFGDNSYIMKAFEITRKYTVQYGETQMKLYYNDYNTHNANKANGIVRICGPIFRSGYLDGIGMQDHDAISRPTAAEWIATYNKFDTICTEMAVTELDVAPESGTQAAQANQYGQLFKCFVERSYKSGRGKIINVSKDGLNDANTMVANSSLWNSADQCKPAFYAVANVGINYNKLDSLVTYADLLQGSDYTPESWLNFTVTLTSSKNAKNQNYSVSVSADTALSQAKDNLITAIQGLVLGTPAPLFALSRISINYGTVTIGAIKKDSVQVSNLGNDTLHITTISSSNTLYTFTPAILALAPSGSAYLVITFASQDTSSQSAFIILTHNASGSPDTIAVNGKGSFPVRVDDIASRIPTEYALNQNYPNPFNPTTKISYSIPQSSFVTLKVYDILGRERQILVNGYQTAKHYSIDFDASKLASGVYLYQLKSSSGFSQIRKMLLIR